MPNNPAHDQPHKKAGVPGAGQFDFKNHAPAALTLDAPEPGPAPRPHDPDQHALLLNQVDRRQTAARKMLDEQDKLSMEVLSSAIRRDYPDAAELRIKQYVSSQGEWVYKDLASVRDKDGTSLTEGDDGWAYRRQPDETVSRFAAFRNIREAFFDADPGNGFAYDQDADEIIVPLDRNYAEGIELQ